VRKKKKMKDHLMKKKIERSSSAFDQDGRSKIIKNKI
jgi:hypothetical protein